MNGDADTVIDHDNDGSAWAGTKGVVAETGHVYRALGAADNIEAWFEPRGGHRPYFAHKKALEWIHRNLGTPGWTLEQINTLPTVNAGQWCDAHGVRLEAIYGTPLHERGATLVDMKLVPTPRKDLSRLRPGELSAPDFTIEGWLSAIGGRAKARTDDPRTPEKGSVPVACGVDVGRGHHSVLAYSTCYASSPDQKPCGPIRNRSRFWPLLQSRRSR